ncbi:ATP-binding protein, partial [Candidatus Saccharibacteria bacterium]|nr:ATP-binding protein [Candidatus Saccharibacteria bacterium]
MKYIERAEYLKTLRELKDKHIIKVITGVRRAGKSTLMQLFREEIAQKIDKSRIQSYNFEDPKYNDMTNWREVYGLIDKKLVKGELNYIFLDEVQDIPGFEKLLDGLYIKENIDLYVTGSNAYLLSSELATILTGRAYEINILPFSFSEFAQTYANPVDDSVKFERFMRYSAFPQATELMHENPALVMNYLRSVYESILVKDMLPRKQIYAERSFENVVNYVMDSIGSSLSPNGIARVLASDNKTVDSQTVHSYLKSLCDSFVLYKAERFDIKGRQNLATQEKYYVVDLGFRNLLLGKEVGQDAGHLLENIIYLELRRRGNEIWVGKIGEREVDFVVRDNEGYLTYYQVAYTVRDEAVLERELAPFDKIPDHNPKVLITLD